MKTFQDLMKDHSQVCTMNTGFKAGMNDTLTRWYNMWWGALTDSHMQLQEDGTWLIIGQLDKNFLNRILYARFLKSAPNTQLPTSFAKLLEFNHLQATMMIHNGAPAVAVGRIPTEEETVMAIRIPPAEPDFHSGEYLNAGCNTCCDDM